MREHRYEVAVVWTGNEGVGTRSYRDYSRDHDIIGSDKPVIAGSADPAFRGDPHRYNPEELFVASLAQCHMLWYLHLAASAQIRVTAYKDEPQGTMVEDSDGAGRFTDVVLRPVVTLGQDSAGDSAKARQLHDRAHEMCFIAQSVNFPVRCEPTIRVKS